MTKPSDEWSTTDGGNSSIDIDLDVETLEVLEKLAQSWCQKHANLSPDEILNKLSDPSQELYESLCIDKSKEDALHDAIRNEIMVLAIMERLNMDQQIDSNENV